MCPIPNNHALLSLGCLLLKVPGASALEFELPSIMARQMNFFGCVTFFRQYNRDSELFLGYRLYAVMNSSFSSRPSQNIHSVHRRLLCSQKIWQKNASNPPSPVHPDTAYYNIVSLSPCRRQPFNPPLNLLTVRL